MIVITGATGNTGRPAAEALLDKGEKVRVIGRDGGRLEPFVGRGAEAFVGEVQDVDAMTRAFAGADAVYLIIPAALHLENFRDYQERVSDAYAKAVATARAPYVVTLSSIGGQHASGTGPIAGLHNLEHKLNDIPGLNLLHLRPTHFMENLLMNIGPLRSMGFLPGAFGGDDPLAMIATKDIGRFAAERLHARDFSGSSARELLGPRDVTMKEVAGIIGKALEMRHLHYMHVPFMVLEPALVKMGLPKSSAALIIEMWKACNNGIVKPEEARSAKNSTPTTIEQFVEEVFVPAYNAKTTAA
jgi:uncharacterized protein YbjT (DUF2867 family)